MHSFVFLFFFLILPSMAGEENSSVMKSKIDSSDASSSAISLPLQVGVWKRSELAQTILPPKIFEYMDGAGELYLAYQLERLEVFEYSSQDQDSILVELYWVKTADDAYGLLSGDWGGEPVGKKAPPSPNTTAVAPESTALYGAGLLRLRSGNLFARVMAYQETPRSREAVLELGRRIMQGRTAASLPEFVRHVPPMLGESWQAQGERLCFFRSHLVLNSVYFLSTENLLHLGPDVEAVILPYKSAGKNSEAKHPKLMLVSYSGEDAAKAALSSFLAGYLNQTIIAAGQGPVMRGSQQIEDGWVAYARQDKTLGLVFECPDEMNASRFVHVALQALHGLPGK
jgi:hypothetical protein